MRLRMRDVGVIDRNMAEQARLRGPVARASGVGDDARADGTLAAAYERLGALVLTTPPAAGDDAARFARRLVEADRALAFAAAADRAGPLPIARQDRVELEAPRGRLIVTRQNDGSFRVDPPSSSLLDLVPAVLIGARYADAVVAVDGLDASAEEAEQAA
jgi:Ni,Fe-hydrogenase III large subunit